MLSSLNNRVNNLQGVTQTSLEKERAMPHAESMHSQGAAGTSLERERISAREESGPVGNRLV